MFIDSIQIIPVKPQNGLVGFAECVINNAFYVGNIAIYSSPSSPSGFRLVFPNKKLSSGLAVDCFHPISREAGEVISSAIIKKYCELMDGFSAGKQLTRIGDDCDYKKGIFEPAVSRS